MSRLRALLVPLLAVALALLLLEGVVRLTNLGGARYPKMVRIANRKGADVQPGMLSLLCYPSNERGYFPIDLRDAATRERYLSLGMRNMDKVLPGSPFAVEQRYNSRGFRGPELPQRRPGVTRVVVIGDSFNQGWGVREEDQYSALLEQRLNAAGRGRFEVLNAALHDADFPRLLFLFKETLGLTPDIVVYGLTLNDPFRQPRVASPPLESSPLVVVRGGPLVEPRAPLAWLDSRLAAVVSTRLQAREREALMLQWYRDLFGPANRHGWRDTRVSIRGMHETIDERGGRFVLMTWPLLIGLDGRYPLEEPHAAVAAMCADFGMQCLDLLPVLRGRPAPSLWVHPVDRHPNEIAQRLVADALAQTLLGQ